MSRRHQLQRHRQQLGEVREIIGAMKSLAFMEARRLNRFLDSQKNVVRGIYSAAEDFLAFYPGCLPPPQTRRQLFLLVGSERGFCGNFNETLVRQLEQCLREAGGEVAGVIACGRKLCGKLEGHPQLKAALDGAAVLDEVDGTLNRIVKNLTEAQARDGAPGLTVLYHDPEREPVVVRELLPPFESLRAVKMDFPYAPRLNLAPEDFLLELAEQYLFATLYEILYVSLMAENQRRMQHLEGALRYLDESLESLRRRGNQLRQEEIIEEIEVILLNVDGSPPA